MKQPATSRLTASANARWLRRLVRCLDFVAPQNEILALLWRLELREPSGYVCFHLLACILKLRNSCEIGIYRLKLIVGLLNLFKLRCHLCGLRREVRLLLWCVFHKMSYYKKIVAETPNEKGQAAAGRQPGSACGKETK